MPARDFGAESCSPLPTAPPLCERAPPVPALDRELRWLRAYALLTYPFVCVPFLFLYFSDHGLDLAQYGTVITAYYVAMFLFDVPTSILADRLSQRTMMVIGPLVLALGFVVLFSWRSFVGFCVGEALMGIGHSILSGPPSTMLYELLRRHGAQHRYLQEESRIHALRLSGTGSSFLLGGVIAWAFATEGGYGHAATLLPTAFLCVLCALCALRLETPSRHPSRRFAEFARQAVADLWRREVRWLLVYWVVLFALLRYPFHNYQVVLDSETAHEPLFASPLFVGLLYAVLNLVAAPLSRRVPQLVQRFGRRLLFWSMPVMLCGSLMAMAASMLLAEHWPEHARGLAWVAIAMFFLQQIPFGMHWALIQEFVNHRIAPEARSTVWSVLSLGGRLIYSPINQGLFVLQQARGLPTALSLCGIVGIAAVSAVMLMRPRGLLRGGSTDVSDRGR